MGAGVERAVLRTAVRLMTEDTTYWQIQDGFAVWAFRPNPTSSSATRLVHARAYGTLCALHIIWLTALPYPVSPFHILLAIHDFPSLIDSSFIGKVHPEIAQCLLAWPLDPNVALCVTTRGQRAGIMGVASSYLGIASVSSAMKLGRSIHLIGR